MNNHPGPPFEHFRQQEPIEAHRRKQIKRQLPLPLRVVECGKPARRRGRASQHMHDNIDATQLLLYALCQQGAARLVAQIGFDKERL